MKFKNIVFVCLFMMLCFVSCQQEFKETLKKARQGDVEAQYKLGEMYNYGEGTEVDFNRAVYWYKKSADQGNPNAQYNLGFMYYYGKGTIIDDELAIYWYKKSAEQGNPFAQYELGIMYRRGRYKEEEGEYWIKKSAAQGYKKAIKWWEEKYPRPEFRW